MQGGHGGGGWQQQPGWGPPPQQPFGGPMGGPPPYGAPQPMLVHRPKSRFGMGCVILLFLLAAAIGGFVYFVIQMTAPPRDASHAFLRELRADDYDGAYALTSQDFKRRVPKETFRTTVMMVWPNVAKSTEQSFSGTSMGDNHACVHGSLSHSGGSSPISLGLVKEGDEWRIDELGTMSSCSRRR